MGFADKMSEAERLGAKRLAKWSQENVRQSKNEAIRSEQRTESMIDDALTARPALSVPEIETGLRQADILWGHASPFNSVTKIAGITKKCKPAQMN